MQSLQEANFLYCAAVEATVVSGCLKQRQISELQILLMDKGNFYPRLLVKPSEEEKRKCT